MTGPEVSHAVTEPLPHDLASLDADALRVRLTCVCGWSVVGPTNTVVTAVWRTHTRSTEPLSSAHPAALERGVA